MSVRGRRRGTSGIPTAGLMLWVDANRIASQQGLADGAAMSSWADQSSSGATIAQATSGNRPTFRIIGGVPLVRFVSAGTGFDVAFSAAQATDEVTTFAVAQQPNAVTTAQYLFHLNGAGIGTSWSLQLQQGVFYGAQAAPRPVGFAVPTTWAVMAATGSLSGTGFPEGLGSASYLNGRRGFRTADANSVTWTSVTGMTAGVIGTLSPGGGAGWFTGDLRCLLHYNRRLSESETQRVLTYLAATYGVSAPLTTPTRNLVFEGDSQTVSQLGQVYGVGFTDGVLAALPATLRSYNLGITGQTIIQMAADAATQVDPLYDASVAKNTLVLWGGTNDLTSVPSAPTTAYNNLVAYCVARKTARPGWKIAVATCLPRQATAQYETDRQAFNTSVRTNYATFADALFDIGADATIGVAGAQNNATYYQGDTIHLTAAGYAIVAGLATTAVNSI